MSESLGKSWYDKHYKKLLILPVIILCFSVFYLYQFEKENGDIVYKDVSLTGGTTITVFDDSVDIEDLKEILVQDFPDVSVRSISNLRTGQQVAFFVETSSDSDMLKSYLENFLGYSLDSENSSIEFTGSSISEGFYHQLRFAIFIAFIFMGLTVFIVFKTPIPSLTVIISAFAGIVMTIVTVNLMNIPLSMGGIAGLLMLIGYSVDTDILLTSRVLRNKVGSLNQRFLGALKTGLTMTLTSIAAVTIALIITYSLSEVLKQVFSILLIGLIFDIFNTWVTNASILKWYVEAKGIQ